jgi:hypothetical protein
MQQPGLQSRIGVAFVTPVFEIIFIAIQGVALNGTICLRPIGMCSLIESTAVIPERKTAECLFKTSA